MFSVRYYLLLTELVTVRAITLSGTLEGEGVVELSALMVERIARRLGRSRRTLHLPADGELAGQQLSYLYRNPRATVLDTAVSEGGEQMVVTVEMDDATYRAFSGKRWG